MRRRLQDRCGLGAGEARLLLGERCLNVLFRQNKRNEYGFAASLLVGSKASESVAAIDELFNV